MEDQEAENSDHVLHPKGSTASQNNMGTLVRTAPPAGDAHQNRRLKETFQVQIKAPVLVKTPREEAGSAQVYLR